MSATIEVMAARMKPLSRRHRIAHLCALISHRSTGSGRLPQLAELLRAEVMAASLGKPSSHRHPDQSARE